MKFQMFKVSEQFYDEKKIGMWAIQYRCDLCNRELYAYDEALSTLAMKLVDIFQKPICEYCQKKIEGYGNKR